MFNSATVGITHMCKESVNCKFKAHTFQYPMGEFLISRYLIPKIVLFALIYAIKTKLPKPKKKAVPRISHTLPLKLL